MNQTTDEEYIELRKHLVRSERPLRDERGESERGWYFVLDGHTPRAEPDRQAWAQWMTEHQYAPRSVDPEGMDDCRVGSTRIGDSWISTTFLGIDHSLGDGPPILFETMVFGGPFDHEQKRYTTWDDASWWHDAMVVRAILYDTYSKPETWRRRWRYRLARITSPLCSAMWRVAERFRWER